MNFSDHLLYGSHVPNCPIHTKNPFDMVFHLPEYVVLKLIAFGQRILHRATHTTTTTTPCLVIASHSSWHDAIAHFFYRLAMPSVFLQFSSTSAKGVPFSMPGMFPISVCQIHVPYTDQAMLTSPSVLLSWDLNPLKPRKSRI